MYMQLTSEEFLNIVHTLASAYLYSLCLHTSFRHFAGLGLTID